MTALTNYFCDGRTVDAESIADAAKKFLSLGVDVVRSDYGFCRSDEVEDIDATLFFVNRSRRKTVEAALDEYGYHEDCPYDDSRAGQMFVEDVEAFEFGGAVYVVETRRRAW